ncbi:hypothetical protein [Streptobacillus ratti]|uniref:hypothetical protein n=1 Tax=Streptobacillus ratti TaxID=1720557 RepID=UPI0009351DAF|nr:hypothetical protein [Streptobacillus ratti]
MNLKYRIFNKKDKKYEYDLFLSQDGRYLTKAEWITTIPLTEDYQVEWGIETKYGTFYENDIVEWEKEYATLYLSECELYWNGYSIIEFDETAKIVGNDNFDNIEDFLPQDENYLYELKAGK